MHKQIENLSIEQMREIVSGAPEWAVFWITRNEYHISMLSFPNMTGQQSYLISNLRTAIAEHDEFKVGDLVVIKANPFWPEDYLIEKVEQKHIGKWYMRYWRHATPEEIKAGHRIDDNTDDVTDIRNHLSPSTVVWDLASGEDLTAEAERHG